MKITLYRWDGITARAIHGSGPDFTPNASGLSYDYDDSNLPNTWQTANRLATLTEGWPANTVYVDLQTGSADFYTNLEATVNANKALIPRFVVRAPGGLYHLNQFRLAGTSGDPMYAFGAWFPAVQGFLTTTDEPIVIQMDANSMSTAQLNAIATTSKASGKVNSMAVCRIDATTGKPVLLGGVKFRAADQQRIASFASDLGIAGNQPAPHHGVVFYSDTTLSVIANNCEFIGAGRACTSAPPFEQGNATSQYGASVVYRRCNFDGRRDAELDPARPVRCGAIMANNETSWLLEDCWVHDTNVSRIAINDQNRVTAGVYEIRRCKVERISSVHNIDPNLNGGASLGGYTNASCAGFENCEGQVLVHDSILSVDTPYSDGQKPAHLQFTSVTSGGVHPNPAGGRHKAWNNTYRHTVYPQLNGFPIYRVPTNSHWYTDGLATTIENWVNGLDSSERTAYIVGSYPPSAATLAAANVTPATHYLVLTN